MVKTLEANDVGKVQVDNVVATPILKPGLWDDDVLDVRDEIVDENGKRYFDKEFKVGWLSTNVQPKSEKNSPVKEFEPGRSANLNGTFVRNGSTISPNTQHTTYFEELDNCLGIS